jgi:general secretion pathway protein H
MARTTALAKAPTSATGTLNKAGVRHPPRATPARGFTLIELLVVVVIIGVVAATMVLSINTVGRDTQLEQERDRLVTLIGYVRERADLQTREYGLHCLPDGYEFVVFDPRTAAWMHDALDSSLRRRQLPVGLKFTLDVEGRRIVLDKPQLTGTLLKQVEDLRPQIMLFSSGDITSFQLRIERGEPYRWVSLTNKEDGTISASAISTEGA